MKFRVLCAAPAGAVPNADLSIEAAELAVADAEVIPRPCTSEADIAAVGAGADGVLTLGIGLSGETLAKLSNCRAIISISHGVNHLDLATATELGIPISNTYFCHEDVANHTIMLLLACARKLTLLHQDLSASRWRRDLLVDIPSIYGQTLGLVGFGHIGAAVARRGQALGLAVVATDPFVDDATFDRAGVRRVDFDELIGRSDFVSLHLPLSDVTHHLIGEVQLRAMRRSAFFLNTARGGLVDERALIRALTEGWIAGAGLDVFEQEPPDATNPLLTLPNVVHTPHSAGTLNASLPNGRRLGAAAMATALRGIWPPHVVNPEVRGATRFPFAESEEERMRLTPEVYLVGGGNFGFNQSDAFDSHVYIVDGGGDLAMIDSGTGRGEDEIIANVRADGLDVDAIRYVLLTHGHLDHAGGAAGLRARLGAQVRATSQTADFLRRGDEDAISLTVARQAGMYPPEYRLQATPVDGELHDGDTLAVGRLVLEVIETPGHCAGHACFVLRNNGQTSLFSGDMLFFGGVIALQRIWDCDLQAHIRSLERLRGLNVDMFFPGHLGFSLKHGQRHIDAALARLDRLLIPMSLQ